MSSLKQVLSDERVKANEEMKHFLKSFQQESEATAARLADLSPSYRAELEEQKQQAKRQFDNGSKGRRNQKQVRTQ